MERRKRSAERRDDVVEQIDWIMWAEEALKMPGGMNGTYSRFRTLSYMNQLRLAMQGVFEPVNTYKGWAELDTPRQVMKGAKARAILRPIMVKNRLVEQEDDDDRLLRFKLVRCMFPVSETEGPELPPWTPPEWSPEQALGALGVREIPFEGFNANRQGYSVGKELAINPVARYPAKTLMHELMHIQLGHTADDFEDYREHRGTCEGQAELGAYLLMNELNALDKMDPAESRGYIQTWLGDGELKDDAIRDVFKAVDSILKAGWVREDEPAEVEAQRKIRTGS
ncbi:hypothetical protein AB0H71_28945 [Nocardia sp. NPDC050697]|uniref:hypothetical protein n=1 Tax=Nocardia sp. NPDC050697 TaxID=3155158 RepID=UPI0033C492F0